jgi:hypothetical protein
MLTTQAGAAGVPPVEGGGGIADPLDLDAKLLGYWENVATDIGKEGGGTVSLDGDHAISWADLSSAGNDLIWDGLASYGLWRPAMHGGCIEFDHATKLIADLTAGYAGDNLAWFAKLAINTLTNNNSRAAAVYADGGGTDVAATGGIFLIARTTPNIQMYRNSGGMTFGTGTAWVDDTLLTTASWFDGANSKAKFYVDGVQIGNDDEAAGNFDADNFIVGNGTGVEYIDMKLVRHCLAKDLTTQEFDDLMDWFVAS